MQVLKQKAIILKAIIITVVIICGLKLYEYYKEKLIIKDYNGHDFNVKLLSINNHEFVFSENFTGDYYIISYFASWCMACKKNLEFLNDIKNTNPKVKIFGIIYNDTSEQVLQDKIYNITFHDIFIDFNNQTTKQFNIFAIPVTILINKNNKITFYYLGTLNNHVINKFINPILNN